MKHLLEQAGKSFLRAFGASALTYALGILAAPNLNQAYVLAAAAVVGSLVAGFRALQEFVPQLSFTHYIKPPYGVYVDSFARAFLGSFIASVAAINAVPDLSTVKSLAVAAIIGAITAGIRAVQAVFTQGEGPNPAFGL